MEDKNTQPTQEELLKAVADVIDEALVEYDDLTKTQGQGIDYAQAVDDKKGDGPKAHSPDGSTGEGSGAADNSGAGAMTKEDDDEKKKKKDKEDEDLKRSYAALVSKMEERGLIAKVTKSEAAPKEEAPAAPAPAAAPAAPAAPAQAQVAQAVAPIVPDTSAVDVLRKSYDEKFEAFGKTLNAIGDSVKKIAAQPVAPRKGLTGAKPLRKNDSDEAAASSLKKSEVVNKLLDLKKSGDKRLEGAGGSSLINRVETNRIKPADVERIKGILGI